MSSACGRSLRPLGGAGARSQDAGNRFQPPRRSPARSQGPVVQRRGDSAQRSAFVAQPPDFRERFLFHWIGFQVFAVGGEPGAESNVSDALALVTLVQ